MPCNLCLWQRWPHIIIVLIAVIALFVRMPRVVLTAIAITALPVLFWRPIMLGLNGNYGLGPVGVPPV